MSKMLFWTCGLVFTAATGLAFGQDLPQPTEAQVTQGDVKVPDTEYNAKLGRTRFLKPNGVVSQDLVVAIITWLSSQFSLSTVEHPVIKLVPSKEIVALRYNPILGPGRSAENQNDTVAIYHDATQTIYLPQDWNGGTPAEQSILVHELVHHFQNMLGLKYECGQAREELAYRAQDRWLRLSGHDLETDFELDGFSLLVKTKCFY
jgi:Domain of unknown function (DUF6647)